MKKIFVIWLMFLLSLSFTLAISDITIQINPIRNTVTPVQNATYSFNVYNNGASDVTLELKYLDVDWTLNPEKVFVPAYGNKNVQLSLVPQPPYTDQKPKIVRIIVSSLDQTFRNEYLLDINVLKYTDIIDQSNSNLIFPDPVDPRKSTVISVRIANKQDASMDNVNIKLISSLVDASKIISVGAKETSTYDFNVNLPKNTEYGIYPISALVTLGDRILANFTRELKIGNFEDIGEEKSVSSSFLVNTYEISKTNNGNSPTNEIIQRRFTMLQSWFTTSKPAPESITNDGSDKIYTWRLALKPGETKTVIIETNYRTFTILLILFIALVIVVYLLTKRDLILKKKLVSIKKETDGTSTIKISITIKNKSFSKLMNIKLMDKVPRIADVPHEFGTAHPRIVDNPGGAQLIWEIVSLNPGEERIFSYKARSKLQVVGKSTIPSAVAKYNKGNRSLTVSSNPEQLFS